MKMRLKPFCALVCVTIVTSGCGNQLDKLQEKTSPIVSGPAALGEALAPIPDESLDTFRKRAIARYIRSTSTADPAKKNIPLPWTKTFDAENYVCGQYQLYYTSLYTAAAGKSMAKHLSDDFEPSTKTGYALLLSAIVSAVPDPKFEYSQKFAIEAGARAKADCVQTLKDNRANNGNEFIPAGAGAALELLKGLAAAFEELAGKVGAEIDKAKKLEALRTFILDKRTEEFFTKGLKDMNDAYVYNAESKLLMASWALDENAIHHAEEHKVWLSQLQPGSSEAKRAQDAHEAFDARLGAFEGSTEEFDQAFAAKLADPIPAIQEQYRKLKDAAANPDIGFDDLEYGFNVILDIAKAAKEAIEKAEPLLNDKPKEQGAS
jgi:hypothetical protein